jgi:hypothetical protein
VLARRWELPADLCMLRGDGGCSDSKRFADSNLGERGDVGRIAGEDRGDGILVTAAREEVDERVGETALGGAALRMWWLVIHTRLVQLLRVTQHPRQICKRICKRR